MNNTICYVPVSVGELIDKYSILEIKSEKINDELKLVHIKNEMEILNKEIQNLHNFDINLLKEIKKVNENLWDIEDRIRIKEKEHTFDDEFIQIARSVYITNDQRYEIKNKINKIYQSQILEFKSYN